MILGEFIEEHNDVTFDTILNMHVYSYKSDNIHHVLLPTFMVPFFLLGATVESSVHTKSGYDINMAVNNMEDMLVSAKLWEEIYSRL